MGVRAPSTPPPFFNGKQMGRHRLLPAALLAIAAVCGFAREAVAEVTESTASAPAVPLFSRHVSAVFSRMGCNGGACHGAVQGKNGFRLSLFAADPAADFEHLARDSRVRRLNLSSPQQSLLLTKAAAEIPHGGGQVLDKGSPEYEMLRRWIAAGAGLDDLKASHIAALEVEPDEQTVSPGSDYQLRVKARFADGTREDVTALCRFESLDAAVATVDQHGRVTAQGVGDAALVVRYRAEPATALVIVPLPAGAPFPDVPEHNFVDHHVLSKLRRLNIPPAQTADDATFLRRVSLDVKGQLPTPTEVREFLADANPLKRGRKIDELLAHPGHAALWTLKFCDLLKASQFGVYADALKLEDDAPRFQAWIRARLEEAISYDELAARILLATSREGRSLDDWQEEVVALFEDANARQDDVQRYARRQTLDLYWQRAESQGVTGALQVAHSFLGLRLECAQCHRHPHDVWRQDDLLSLANFFTRVRPVGFQSANEKKFPEVAERFTRLNEQANELAEEAKQLKQQFKDYDRKVREAKASKDQERIVAIEKEYEEVRATVNRAEARARNLREAARRMMQAEVRHLVDDKLFASMTSPLGTQTSQTFRLLGATEPVEVSADEDPREKFVAWLRSPENPYFAQALVSRVWTHYFGRGILEPADDLSPLNPASHPELLHELSREFIRNGYSLPWLHRTLLMSRTYQQASEPNGTAAADRRNFARFYYRRLPAEVLLDAIDQATGTRENMDMKYHRWPEEMRAVEMPFEPRNAYIVFMLRQFGRPQRASSVQCDCERDPNSSVLQVLSLANHPRIWEKIASPEGRIARIVRQHSDPTQRVEEVFLSTVSRLPTDEERATCVQYLADSPTPEAGLQGVMWSLLNTREFLVQH